MSPEEFEAKIREDKKGCMTSTPLGHKKCLDKWGAVHVLLIKGAECKERR